ncbi:peptidase C26 family protein [Nitzschia inconspicua]|uniref:folate gamma-glutamyl hydrolase n=1 Tax=Nitzschia inconspicua TaxID=303405 RepID=A0A9K3M6L6_9STRA|nr:peptidase C26 family protein [Nitzschia inconspicua]
MTNLLFALWMTLLLPIGATTITPTIGILSQPLHGSKNNNNETYIAASYVKWLEVGGARSIVIPYDASTEMVHDIMSQIDGVLFPGGGAPVPPAAKDVWRLLQHRYQVGDLIPLWGTCLGMEFIVQLATNQFDDDDNHHHVSILEEGYDSTNISLPLLQVDKEGLYRSDYIYDAVVHHNITLNNHHIAIRPNVFRDTPQLLVSQYWKITSTNLDLQGKPFVSTMEPIDPSVLPVYGVQFHPEKNAFEYGLYPNTNIPYEAIDHSPPGIAMSTYMASFFVQLARENMISKERTGVTTLQTDGSHPTTTASSVIYPLIYTYPRRVGYKFEEIYIIPSVISGKAALAAGSSSPYQEDPEITTSKPRKCSPNPSLRRGVLLCE